MSNSTKILIIRFSSIGDIVLTSPVVRCLKEQLYGGCEIHFLVKKEFAPILQANPHIDHIHILDNSLKEISEKLKQIAFVYIIDLHKNIRSFIVRNRLRALAFSFRKLNFEKWLLVNFKINLLPDIHIVDRYFEAVSALGIINDGKGLDYFIPDKDNIDTEKMFGLAPGTYAVFAIGGAHSGKKLPPSHMSVLCAKLGLPIILLGGLTDKELGHSLENAGKDIRNACGKLSINGSASVINQAGLVISHDSGMMHIAAAFTKKIISIWGATVPEFGMYPYKPDPRSVMIQADHLKFRPTSKLGNRNSRKERRTVEEIEVDRIVSEVRRIWET